jgi:two-component system response regulator AtoC
VARLEAIKQLAGGLTDGVAVMDRHLNIIYANKSASTEAMQPEAHGKCYEMFGQSTEICESCPTPRLFDSPNVQSLTAAGLDRKIPCDLNQAFPLISDKGDVELIVVLFKQGTKPAPADHRSQLESAPIATQHESLRGLIGRSPAMQQLFEMVSLVADSTATVLIQGESGTGKELVAKTIHELSYRRTKPFVVVDCGSLPETLLESELFGHMKGSFTGASSSKRGLFEEADGGTIFLDEIADTSATFQAKLLRVLQEGEVKRVGSTRPTKIDVRVISATNKDLAALVSDKLFRQDLYYRLSVLPLCLPPLRERREDIPLLVERFVAESCQRHRQPRRTVSSVAMKALTQATWPGNVRELQHYLERAVVTTAGPDLTCEDLMGMGSEPMARDLRSISRDAVKEAERARIIQALQESDGNRIKTAKLLKISRASLYNKLRTYEIH